MIWAKEKAVTLEIGDEELKIVFDIPSAIDVEELLEEMKKSEFPRDSIAFNRFVTHVDGFNSAEDFSKTPGTKTIVSMISQMILDSATIDVKVKNASASSTV